MSQLLDISSKVRTHIFCAMRENTTYPILQHDCETATTQPLSAAFIAHIIQTVPMASQKPPPEIFIYLTHHPTAASTNNLAYTLCSIPGTPPNGSSFGAVVTASNDIAFSRNSASCRFSFSSAVRAKKLSRSRGRNGVSFGERQPRKSSSVGDFPRTRK